MKYFALSFQPKLHNMKLIHAIGRNFKKFSSIHGIVVVWALLFVSCKKEIDEIGPGITISSPSEGAIYNYEDLIPISATISDDKKLSSVVVSITNSQGQAFLGSINITNPDNPLTLNQTIVYDNLLITGGTYFVRITASDGENESVVFRQITLVESPKVLKRIYVMTQNVGQLNVDTLAGSQINNWMTLPYEYHFGQVFSRSQTFSLAHSGNRLNVLDAMELTEQWTTSIPNIFGNNFFTCSTTDIADNKFYVGCADGKVRRVDATGGLSELFTLPQSFIPKKILTHDQYLIVLQENILQTQQQIAVFNKYFGFFIQSAAIDFDVKSLLNTGEALKIILAGNSGNESEFRYYNIETNFTNGVFTLYNQSLISDAWPVANNRFMCAHSDGIFLYDYNINSLSGGLSIAAKKIIPDETGARCFVISDAGFHIINNAATQEVLFVAKNGVVDMGVVYNK